MAVSLEARVPLLDHRVVEFAWRLPSAMKLAHGGGTKRVLRRILGRHLPSELFERPKMGFSVPLDAWLRGPLREWAEALLAEDRLRAEGIFDARLVRERWSGHLSGQRSGEHQIWCVLMFQAWWERERG